MARFVRWIQEYSDPRPLFEGETVELRGAGAVGEAGKRPQSGILVLTTHRLWLQLHMPWPLRAESFDVPLSYVESIQRTGKRSLLDPYPWVERVRIRLTDGQEFDLQAFHSERWIARINDLRALH